MKIIEFALALKDNSMYFSINGNLLKKKIIKSNLRAIFRLFLYCIVIYSLRRIIVLKKFRFQIFHWSLEKNVNSLYLFKFSSFILTIFIYTVSFFYEIKLWNKKEYRISPAHICVHDEVLEHEIILFQLYIQTHKNYWHTKYIMGKLIL